MKGLEIHHSIFHLCICHIIAISTREPAENNMNEEEENTYEDANEKIFNTKFVLLIVSRRDKEQNYSIIKEVLFILILLMININFFDFS